MENILSNLECACICSHSIHCGRESSAMVTAGWLDLKLNKANFSMYKAHLKDAPN